MIAVVVFVIGFLIAWKLSLRAVARGGIVLIVILALMGGALWLGQMPSPDEFALAYAPPDGVEGMRFGFAATETLLLGFVTGAAVVALLAYGIGALTGRLLLRFGNANA